MWLAFLLAELKLRPQVVEERLAQDCLAKYEVAELPSGRCAFVRTGAKSSTPLILVHGFDSSALEFRRLLPELEKRGVEAYAYDVYGWGFSDGKVSVDAKRQQLRDFTEFLGLNDYCVVGASLGGALALDYAYANSVKGLGLIAPQCLVDGTPDVPSFLARWGVRFLKSRPLRSAANRMAYFDQSLATADAINVGKLHCDRPGWEDDQVEWLLGNGYSVSSRLSQLDCATCVFWGADDQILPVADNIPKLRDRLPSTARLKVYDACGHVPHLERPANLADDLVTRLLRQEDTAERRVFDWSQAPPFPPAGTPRRTVPPPTVRVDWTNPVTLLGLLFFVPLFSSELFFAISRQFICGIGSLCQPVVPV